jgi:hypothetical protein
MRKVYVMSKKKIYPCSYPKYIKDSSVIKVFKNLIQLIISDKENDDCVMGWSEEIKDKEVMKMFLKKDKKIARKYHKEIYSQGIRFLANVVLCDVKDIEIKTIDITCPWVKED